MNLPAQNLVDSGLGSNFIWAGMYARRGGNRNILSVATSVASSTTQTIKNWKVTGYPVGPLVFHPKAPYLLTSYPSVGSPVYQAAPTAGAGAGQVLISSAGDGAVLEGPANGGTTTTYAPLTDASGVTTRPAGQY